MPVPKGTRLGTRPETEYIISETEHLLFCGMNPEDIAKALNRTPSALAKLFDRNGYKEIAAMFANLRYRQERDAA